MTDLIDLMLVQHFDILNLIKALVSVSQDKVDVTHICVCVCVCVCLTQS